MVARLMPTGLGFRGRLHDVERERDSRVPPCCACRPVSGAASSNCVPRSNRTPALPLFNSSSISDRTSWRAPASIVPSSNAISTDGIGQIELPRVPANFRRENRHQRVVGQRRHWTADLIGGKPRQIRGDAVNRRLPLPSRQRLPDIGQKLQCLNEVFAAASHPQRHAMLEEQPLRRVVIHRFQPAKRAPVARMLHDDGHLAQSFEGSHAAQAA